MSDHYCTNANVQSYIPLRIWTLGTTAQPATADITQWVAEVGDWIDSAFAWRYTTPIHDDDINRVRSAAALLVAARVLKVRAILAFAGPHEVYEQMAARYEADAYLHLVYHPAGTGSRQPGGSVVISGQNSGGLGRALLVLPNTAEVSGTTESDDGLPEAAGSSAVEPGEGDDYPDRTYSLDMDL